jgi:hypothetical protein
MKNLIIFIGILVLALHPVRALFQNAVDLSIIFSIFGSIAAVLDSQEKQSL